MPRCALVELPVKDKERNWIPFRGEEDVKKPEPNKERGRKSEPIKDSERVRGIGRYKGRDYLLLWHGSTKYGHKAKLGFRDGTSTFWIDYSRVEITKKYKRPVKYWENWERWNLA